MRAVLKQMPAALAALCAAALAGCAPQPLLDPAAPTPPLALVPIAAAGISDGRARFREILCRLNEHHGATLPDHRPCEEILHRLPGEARPRARPVNLARAALPLRLVIVPGLTAECFGALATPLPPAARHVEQLGYETSWVEVAGLASSAQNAAAVQAAIARLAEAAAGPIVLLGYSKGIGDVLQAVTDPTTARRVTAVVSLGGAVNGSPLADQASPAMLRALAALPGMACEPEHDAGLASLRRAERTGWLATTRLPAAIRYYSLASFAARERTSRILLPAWDDLALIEPRNDGQLLFYDQLLPHGTLLGYLNADHWAIALPIAREHPVLAATLVDANAFPREILLEAILKHIEEDLQGFGRERSGDAPVVTTQWLGAR
jgi:hypothetical protein